MKKKNEILELSFEFAKEVIQYCHVLENDRKYIVGRQLLKCGTSIGANVREAQSPQSRADFISKMTIAIKEARESEYWLLLCKESPDYPEPQNLLRLNSSILKLLSRIISSAKKGPGKNPSTPSSNLRISGFQD